MVTSEARVPTDRAGRYLTQFCKHANEMVHRRPHDAESGGVASDPGRGEVRRVEWSDTDGEVVTSWGRWTLHTEPDALVVRAEAADEAALARIERLITRRLEGFGRRDQLVVRWTRVSAETGESGGESADSIDADPAADSGAGKGLRRRWSRRIAGGTGASALGGMALLHSGLGPLFHGAHALLLPLVFGGVGTAGWLSGNPWVLAVAAVPIAVQVGWLVWRRRKRA